MDASLAALALVTAFVVAGCASSDTPTTTVTTSAGTVDAGEHLEASQTSTETDAPATSPVTAAGPSDNATTPAANLTTPAAKPTAVGHVFVIVLENEDYATTFPDSGDAPAPYLAKDLVAQGTFLRQYYGTGHASLDNYIAMVSGQAPNVVTQADCAYYADFIGVAGGPDGQAIGQGCVYPTGVKTIGNQLSDAGLTWRQYAEDMANGTTGVPTNCRHQAINAQDTWQGSSSEKDQYATRHVPFVYFHAVIDDQAFCDDHVVDLGLLPAQLEVADKTPNLVFITPDVCSDGHDAVCKNPNQRGEYDGINDFLTVWVPRILSSPAYQKDGLLVITFDEAEAASPDACCGEPSGPNTLKPGLSGAGGGRTGAVLLSPCLEPGTVDDTPYNHYSLLRTMEDVYGLDHLGYAGQDGLVPMALGTCSAAPVG